MTITQHARTLHKGTEAERQALTSGVTEGDLFLETDTNYLRVWLASAWNSLGVASVIDNVSDPPTDAELTSIFGEPENMPNGARIFVNDAGTDTTLWEVTPMNSHWWYTSWEKADSPTLYWKDINLGAALLSLPAATQPDEVQVVDEVGANTGIYTWGFDINELVSGVFEMQHDYYEGGDVVFHIHWGGNAAPTGTDYVKWQLTYSIIRDSNTINAPTTIYAETAYDTQYEWVRSDFTTITGSTGGIDGGNILIGDQFFFYLKRIAADGAAYGGDALVATLGLHYQVDALGSSQMGSK